MAGLEGSGIGRLRGMLGGKPSRGTAIPAGSREEANLAHQLLGDYERSGLGWFWSTDADGRIVYLSNTVASLLGEKNGVAAGSVFADLFQRAENDGAQDAPEEHAMLIFTRNREVREDQRDDEDVVERERGLEQIAGEILNDRLLV